MHIGKLIRRRFPKHGDRIVQILVLVLGIAILIGIGLLLTR